MGKEQYSQKRKQPCVTGFFSAGTRAEVYAIRFHVDVLPKVVMGNAYSLKTPGHIFVDSF